MKTKKEIENNIEDIANMIHELTNKKQSLQIDLVKLLWPYKYGDRIKNTETGEVRVFDNIYYGRFAPEVRLFSIKKNGEMYKQSRWEMAMYYGKWGKV